MSEDKGETAEPHKTSRDSYTSIKDVSFPAVELSGLLRNAELDPPKTVSERVLATMAREDYFVTKCAIQLLPLKFRESSVERSYQKWVNVSVKPSMVLVGALGCFSAASLIIAVGLCIHYDVVPFQGIASTVLFYLAQGVTILCALTVAVSPFVPKIRAHAEVLLHVCFGLIFFSICGSFFFIVTLLKPTTFLLTAFALKCLSDTCTFGAVAFTNIIYSCIFQMRTRYTVYITASLCVIVCALYVTQVVKINMVTDGTLVASAERLPSIVTVTILMTFVQCFTVVSLSAFGFISSYVNELQQRIVFYRCVKAEEHVLQLQNRVRGKANGTTTIERIIQYIETSIELVQESGLLEARAPLRVAVKALRSSINRLTKADQLFAISLEEGEGGNGERVDALEERFYGIYAHIATLRAHFGGKSSVKTFRLVKSRQKLPSFLLRDIQLQQLSTRVGQEWTLNLPLLSQETDTILQHVGTVLLSRVTPVARDKDIAAISKFLIAIENLYLPNPYHNSLHGAMVAHASMAIAEMINIFTYNELEPSYRGYTLTFIVAALCHDVGHPGRNNLFLTNSLDSIAILYNDFSVLESFHSAITIHILRQETEFFVGHFDIASKKEMRQRLIELILATDMRNHFDLISRFRIRQKSNEFDYVRDPEDFWLVLRMLLKTADVSHVMVEWYQHVDWSLRVAEEFYQQGSHEKVLGIPISPLCDRDGHGDFARAQKGFIEFVVQPLVKEIDELVDGDEFNYSCVRLLLYNKNKWEEMISLNQTLDIPQAVRSSQTMTLSPAVMFCSTVLQDNGTEMMARTGRQSLDIHSETSSVGNASKRVVMGGEENNAFEHIEEAGRKHVSPISQARVTSNSMSKRKKRSMSLHIRQRFSISNVRSSHSSECSESPSVGNVEGRVTPQGKETTASKLKAFPKIFKKRQHLSVEPPDKQWASNPNNLESPDVVSASTGTESTTSKPVEE